MPGLAIPRANVPPKQALFQHYFTRAPSLHPWPCAAQDDCDWSKNKIQTRRKVYSLRMIMGSARPLSSTAPKQSMETGLAMRNYYRDICEISLFRITQHYDGTTITFNFNQWKKLWTNLHFDFTCRIKNTSISSLYLCPWRSEGVNTDLTPSFSFLYPETVKGEGGWECRGAKRSTATLRQFSLHRNYLKLYYKKTKKWVKVKHT